MMLAYFALFFLATLGITTTLDETSPSITSTYYASQPGSLSKGSTPIKDNDHDVRNNAYATNLLIYATAVTRTLNLPANATFKNGAISDSLVKYPAGFSSEGWAHYVEDKLSQGRYVYFFQSRSSISANSNVTTLNGMARVMAKVSKGDYLAGEARGGRLFTAGSGYNSVLILPAAANIPESSPLYITIIK